MSFKTYFCPCCGANYNPAKYTCPHCGSYIFMLNENYTDFSKIKIDLPQKTKDASQKYPGIYVFGRLLGRGEKPIALGAANYFTGLASAGGKLLLTNKSLSFSAHAFNVGRQETIIDLKQITDVQIGANFLISQNILVTADGELHKFAVYHGKEWIQKINNAIAEYDEFDTPASEPNVADYIEELQQLKHLFDIGVISEDEFNIKKRMLLGI